MATANPYELTGEDNPFGKYSKALDALSSSSQYSATTGAFDESKGAAGRVAQITSKDSPLMQTARTRAAQAATRRGLRNSTMGVQAGEQAVIETATPLAQTDASLYSQQQIENQRAANDAARSNAAMRGQIGMKGMDLAESGRQFDVGQSNSMSQFTKSLAQRAAESAQQNDQFGKSIALDREKLDAQRDQFAKSLGLEVETLDLRRSELSQRDQQFLKELDLRNQELKQRETLAAAEMENRKTLAQMDADNRLKLMEAEAAYKNDIAGNENIAGAWATMMQGITQIQNNPELESDAKATLIQNQVDSFKSFSNFWKKVSGKEVDVSDLLNFGPTGGGGTPAAQPSGGMPESPIAGDGTSENPYVYARQGG